MERAFIVTKESEYHRDLDDYLELQRQQKEFINKYFDEKGIDRFVHKNTMYLKINSDCMSADELPDGFKEMAYEEFENREAK